MILDSTTEKITLILAGATTTNPGDCDANWTTSDPAAVLPTPTFGAGSNSPQTNGTTSVDLVPVPTTASMRVSVEGLSVVNRDTQPMTVTIRKTDGATNRVVFGPCTIQVGEKIQYKRESGWNVFTVAGAVKVTAVQSTVEPGYIDGLRLSWNSGTSISVSSGTAYIPSVGANVNFPSSITKAGLALSASTFYHVYGFLNAGVPDVEIVTTAPSSAYNGVARTKSGDTTRRYLGSVLTDGSSAVHEFEHNSIPGLMQYRAPLTNAAPFRVLSNGSSTTPLNIGLSLIVPVTAITAMFRGINTSTAGAIVFYVNQSYAAPNIMGNIQQAPTGTTFTCELIMPCLNQNIAYSTAAATGAFLDVKGYWFER